MPCCMGILKHECPNRPMCVFAGEEFKKTHGGPHRTDEGKPLIRLKHGELRFLLAQQEPYRPSHRTVTIVRAVIGINNSSNSLDL